MSYEHTLYFTTSELPQDWDEVAKASLFLQSSFLSALESSTPFNISHQFVGIFETKKLCAVALIQQIDLKQLETFGVRDSGIKILIRNFLFKKFASKLVLVGNNLITGQHAIGYRPGIEMSEILTYIKSKVIPQYTGNHIQIFKDFPESQLPKFDSILFKSFLRFTSQPSMCLHTKSTWLKEDDYVQCLTKKYRDQYKRARKKADGIEKRQLNAVEINTHEDKIYELYTNVAKNASFNTFFLTKNHFFELKVQMGERFRFFAYFDEGELIGFNTLFQHEKVLETYFLGYNPKIQKEKLLYLNMLYDMVGCATVNGFTTINFGRTAMEIKSSVGAIPENMFGLMEHQLPFINNRLSRIFSFLEPDVEWIQRHPFKD